MQMPLNAAGPALARQAAVHQPYAQPPQFKAGPMVREAVYHQPDVVPYPPTPALPRGSVPQPEPLPHTDSNTVEGQAAPPPTLPRSVRNHADVPLPPSRITTPPPTRSARQADADSYLERIDKDGIHRLSSEESVTRAQNLARASSLLSPNAIPASVARTNKPLPMPANPTPSNVSRALGRSASQRASRSDPLRSSSRLSVPYSSSMPPSWPAEGSVNRALDGGGIRGHTCSVSNPVNRTPVDSAQSSKPGHGMSMDGRYPTFQSTPSYVSVGSKIK